MNVCQLGHKAGLFSVVTSAFVVGVGSRLGLDAGVGAAVLLSAINRNGRAEGQHCSHIACAAANTGSSSLGYPDQETLWSSGRDDISIV